MKVKSILTILLLAFTTFIFAQTNQLDSQGKKDGKWILYLDAHGNNVKDSTSATYWRYTYYDHGTHIYPMGGFIEKGGKIEASNNSNQADKIKMLDGEYKCFDPKGNLKSIHTFKNGEYLSYKEFDSGELRTCFDYTIHCDGQPHSWKIFIYGKNNGSVTIDCVKKDEKGHWPKMRG